MVSKRLYAAFDRGMAGGITGRSCSRPPRRSSRGSRRRSSSQLCDATAPRRHSSWPHGRPRRGGAVDSVDLGKIWKKTPGKTHGKSRLCWIVLDDDSEILKSQLISCFYKSWFWLRILGQEGFVTGGFDTRWILTLRISLDIERGTFTANLTLIDPYSLQHFGHPTLWIIFVVVDIICPYVWWTRPYLRMIMIIPTLMNHETFACMVILVHVVSMATS